MPSPIMSARLGLFGHSLKTVNARAIDDICTRHYFPSKSEMQVPFPSSYASTLAWRAPLTVAMHVESDLGPRVEGKEGP